MQILALCAGIGGLELGIKLATHDAARTVCICEGEAYCASVLRARMQDGHLDECPIWSDVRSFDPEPWRGKVDCVTAGYPCQPFSAAGRRRGHEDPRHLWPHIADHVRVLRPAYVFCENVPGHVSLGFDQVCADLSEMGYSVEAGVFSAAEVGAPHLRKRLFFLAYAEDSGRQPRARDSIRTGASPGQRLAACAGGENVANATSQRLTQGSAQQVLPRAKRSRLRARSEGSRTDVADAGSARCDEGQRSEGGPFWNQTRRTELERRSSDVADTNSERQLQQSSAQPDQRRRLSDSSGGDLARNAQRGLGKLTSRHANLVDHLARGWPADWEYGVPRVAEGQRHRIDRLRALGNAVVPQTAALAWRTLMAEAIAHGHEPLVGVRV